MSTELQELLAQIEAVAAKDVEVGRALKAIVAYLATQETQKTQPLKGGN